VDEIQYLKIDLSMPDFFGRAWWCRLSKISASRFSVCEMGAAVSRWANVGIAEK
jgi:hypothetical protein